MAETVRKPGVSEQTFYRCKKPFAGLGVAERHACRVLDDFLEYITTMLACRRSETMLVLSRL